MEERSSFNILGLIIKITIGIAMLFVAYLLFRYAATKGDWGFISEPLKNFANSFK